MARFKKGDLCKVAQEHVTKYPEHAEKIFTFQEVDDEDYAELEWVHPVAEDRTAYVKIEHLVPTKWK